MTEQASVHAILAYLREEFPGADIWSVSAPDRAEHSVNVRTSAGVLSATASPEFLRDTPQESVRSLVAKWNLAAVMERGGPSQQLLITSDGLRTAI